MTTLARKPLPAALCAYCGQQSPSGQKYCCAGCETLAYASVEPSPPVALRAHWQSWDTPTLSRDYNFSEDPSHSVFVFSIDGLRCASCVHLLEQIPRMDDAVENVEVRWGQSQAVVRARTGTTVGRLADLIENLGYKPTPLSPTDEPSKPGTRRDEIKRLAVAGFCAGNLMLFSIPLYGGADGIYPLIFGVISSVLFLPVLFYSAAPILMNAWNGLRARVWHADLPLAIALVSTSLLSFYNAFTGSDHFYFDSTAGFIFLILTVRFFHQSTLGGLARRLSLSQDLLPKLATILEGTRVRAVNVARLRPGQTVILHSDEIVATDSRLDSDMALFDTAWVDGETLPRWFQKGQSIAAGLRARSNMAVVTVEKSADDSDLVRALRQMELLNARKGRRLRKYETIARALVIAVTSIAIVMIGAALLWQDREILNRALALMIVACPCALLLGGPAIYAAALGKAREHGLLLKDSDVLDRILECKDIAFDKTGTLTTGELHLVEQTPAYIPTWQRELILRLESLSAHPVAFAFRRLFRDHFSDLIQVENLVEVPGREVSGFHLGKRYTLRSHPDPSEGLRVVFLENDVTLAEFLFDDRLRDETPALVSNLSTTHTLHILSGDREHRVQQTAAALGVPSERAHGRLSPAQKIETLQKRPFSVMIGDGLNDAGVLAAAHVGVAVSGAVEASMKSASVYAFRPGLRPIADLVAIANLTASALRRNIALALTYNIAAGLLAVTGYIDPLLAAVLMPASSGLILLSTWIFMKERLT